MKTSNKMLLAVVTAVTIYTIASFALAFRGIEISPTLTGAYFAFWGTEIIAMASIKNTKVKNDTTANNVVDEYVEEGNLQQGYQAFSESENQDTEI